MWLYVQDLSEEMALDVNPSHLKDLDLSNNQLGDSGVIQISHLLKNPQFKLHKLTLSDCGVREEGYAALAEALRSNPSSELMELDLRGNHPGDSGVKPLDDLLQNKKSKLNTLRLLGAAAEEAFNDLKKVVSINLLEERKFDLSQKIHGDSGVKKLSDLLKDPHCRPTTLRLSQCNLTDEGCSALFQVLSSDSSTVRELDLSNNQIQDSGVRLISDLLNNPNCKLHTVRLSDCGVGEEGYAALAEALRSNPSSELMELDLRGNHPGDSGVKPLYELLEDPDCKLKTLRLLRPDAETGFEYLRNIVNINPLLQRELDLREKIHGDPGVKKLSDLLKDPHCRTTKLVYVE
ncbi:ribonuclease inhibitor-like [Trichomycterus rosablanca]|uniref:ribonuclease inhibitor-like n=1 Tax=Trichomycterus rosablanca TaxID=2290929 RepID=UPI002F35FC0C